MRGLVDTERLFLAIALPGSARNCMAERVRIVAKPAERVRWVPIENVHITLKFLGETPAAQRSTIEATMERVVASVPPLGLAITGVKVVRRGRRPQMVWATVADTNGRLQRLHDRTERLLESEGFAREVRSFSPHITLARVRDGVARWEQESLENWTATQRDVPSIPFHVAEVLLMKSELKPQGAEYMVCRRFGLRGT